MTLSFINSAKLSLSSACPERRLDSSESARINQPPELHLHLQPAGIRPGGVGWSGESWGASPQAPDAVTSSSSDSTGIPCSLNYIFSNPIAKYTPTSLPFPLPESHHVPINAHPRPETPPRSYPELELLLLLLLLVISGDTPERSLAGNNTLAVQGQVPGLLAAAEGVHLAAEAVVVGYVGQACSEGRG